MELTIGLALIAGLVSFISPCVLPLVPAYVGYMGGRMTHAVAAQATAGGSVRAQTGPTLMMRLNTFFHSLAFVFGFALVFVTIGLLSTAFIQVVGGQNISLITNVIGRVGGVVIIVFGLQFMGYLSKIFEWLLEREDMLSGYTFSVSVAVLGSILIVWGFVTPYAIVPVLAAFLLWLGVGGAFTNPGEFWHSKITSIYFALNADTRPDMDVNNRNGLGGSALMGVVFAAGWTPCIGPVYGAVLTLAANGGDVAAAGGMLTAYSLGLGIPFILTALLLDSAQGVLRRLNRHMTTIKLVSGGFLIIIGLAVASGQLQRLSQTFTTGEFGEASIRLEERVLSAVTGEEVDSLSLPGTENAEETSVDEFAPADAAPEEAGVTVESVESENVGTSVGQRAPGFSTITETGDAFSLADAQGDIVLLNFWATWCGPCRIEMPEFEEAFQAHGENGFTIVAVNNRENAQQVADFRDELGVTFPMVMDQNGQIQDEYGIFSYPSSYVLDRDGNIIARHFGIMTAEQLDEILADAI